MDSANDALAASVNKPRLLLRRVLSVAVLLPIIIGLVYAGVLPVALLTAAAVVVALLELYAALQRSGYEPRRLTGILSGLLLCAAATLQSLLPTQANDWIGFALAASLLVALVAEIFRHNHAGSLEGWTLTFACACYTGWLLSHYILLRGLHIPLEGGGGWLAFLHLPPGAAWVFLVLAITWFDDTMAYVVGSTWGRHQMAPYLSPKKSWEGAIGGFVASVLVALLAVPLLGLPLSYPAAAVLGMAGGIAGQVGDLVESLIKRQIGTKDIGHIIPGHGGLLDRLDSMLFTAPVLYYLILLLTVPS
jgi:phosphatidate cytidylyltransferase